MSKKRAINDTERPEVALCEDCVFIHPLRYGLVRKTIYKGFANKFFPLPESNSKAKALDVENAPHISEKSTAQKQLLKETVSRGTAKQSTTRMVTNLELPYSCHTKSPEQEDIWAEEAEEPVKPDRYGYEFAALPLRDGWLYTFESEKKVVKEYEISSANGVAHFTLRRFNKSDDQKIQSAPRFQKSFKGVPVARDMKQLQLNFCETQWDESLLEDIVYGNNKDILSNFQSFSVEDWVAQGQDQQGVFSRDDIKQYYVPNYTDTVGFEDIYKERLADSVDPVNHPFVCVHDRWGAASDICEDIARLETLHEAIIQSSKTGIAVDVLHKALLDDPIKGVANAKEKYQENGEDISFDDFEKQYLLAASTYNSIELELARLNKQQSGAEEVIEELKKQSKKVDWSIIYRILNIKERRSMRVNINNTRTGLLAYIKSDYYNDSFKEVPDGFADKLCESKNILIAHDQFLIREPGARDVDIISDYEKRLDLSSFYENKLAEDSEYSKLMTKAVNVGEGLLDKADGAIQVLNILDTYVGYFDGEKQIKILTKYLNSVNFRELDFDVQVSKISNILEYAEEISMESGRREFSNRNQITRAIYDHLESGSSIPHIRIRPRANKAVKVTQKWLKGMKLEELGMGLSVFNLITGLRGVQDDDSRSNMQKAISVGAASFAATQSIMAYLAARDALAKKLIGRTVSKTLVKKMGVIADGLCIIESVLNVRQAFLVRNNMQAYAYMGATAVSVASLVFTIKGTITVSAAIGTGTGGVGLVVLKAVWPLLILAALAIFFAWWTASLAFTPLVKFYANYLFNKKGIAELKRYAEVNFSKSTHGEIMRLLHKYKDIVINKEFKRWRNYNTLLLEFESLYPMIGVRVESDDLRRSWEVLKVSGFLSMNSAFKETCFHRINTISFECQLLQISAQQNVEYGLLSCSRKRNGSGNRMVEFMHFDGIEVDDKTLKCKIKYDFSSIEASKFHEQGYFYIRLVLSEQQGVYWPHEMGGKPRYFFVKTELKEVIMTRDQRSANNSRETRDHHISLCKKILGNKSWIDYETEKNLMDAYNFKKYNESEYPTNLSEKFRQTTGSFLNAPDSRKAFNDYQDRKTLLVMTMDEFKESHNIVTEETLEKKNYNSSKNEKQYGY